MFAASPVYYQAPLYRRLAADPRIDFTAIFASDQGAKRPFENQYHAPVEWGVDSLGGYRSIFLKNAYRNPSGGSVFDLRDLDIVGCVRRGRFEALWLHGYHTVTHVLAAATQKALGGAVLYREDQTLLSPRPRWKSLVKDVGLRWLFRGAFGLFVGTENLRWFERWGMAPGRLFHVPYAVDNESFQRAGSDLCPQRAELRAKFGIKTDGPVVLSVGRLVEKKQPLSLLRAFQRVRRLRQCSLVIVGTGPLEQEMRRVTASEGIPDVVFAGFLDQTELPFAYAIGDTLALISSHDETWGIVVNEAMNFGLPIVVSNRVGSAVDLVVSEENGFVVPHDDLDAIATALLRLVESSDLRKEFGEASLRRIQNWTYDVTADGLIAGLRASVGNARWALAEATPRRMTEA